MAKDIRSVAAWVAKKREEERKAEIRTRKALTRYAQTKEKRRKAESRLRREFRRRTGVSVREIQRSTWWMRDVKREAEVELMKADISLWIKEAGTIDELAKILNRANYMVRKHKKLAELSKHTEEIESLYLAGLLERWQIEAIMRYGGKKVD